MKKELYNQIIKLFSFSEELCQRVIFIKEYHEKVQNFLKNNTLLNDQIVRYMLVGFYFDYRGAVHRSDDYNTKRSGRKDRQLKYDIFNQCNKKAISSSQEYLQLLTLKRLEDITGEKLFNFVILNEPISKEFFY